MPRNYRSKKLSYKQKRSQRSQKKGGSKINNLRSDNHLGGSRSKSRKQRGGFVRGGTNILNITPQKGGYIRGNNKSKRRLRRKLKINRKGGGCGCSMNKNL